MRRLINWKLTAVVFGIVMCLLFEEKERLAPDTESDVSARWRN
jgi:hypothetical protein